MMTSNIDNEEFDAQEEAFAFRRLKRAVIREELVAITEDFLEGLILGQMLYWTERVRHFDVFLKEEIQRNENHTESIPTIEPIKGWFTKTAKDLNEELMLRMSEPTIRTKLKSLIEKKLLFERQNPYQRWNHSRQYRVSLLQLEQSLYQKGYHLEGYPRLGNLGSNERILASELNDLETISKNNTNTKNIFSKENISVPDGTHLINNSNLSLSQEGSFISISKYPIENSSVKIPSSMSQRIRQRTVSEIENSSHKGTQRKPLPSIDQMPKVLQTWYSLPLVTKPTNKTYHRIIRLLNQLKQGKFPTEYNLLNRDFTNPSAPGVPSITKQHVKKVWTEEELVELLDTRLRLVIENAAYWPENKERSFKGMSFESFVFNPRSGRSKLLDLYVRRPQMLRRESEKILLKEDPYPEAMSVLSDVFDCIDKRRHPEQYVKATRHFSRIMEFLHALPGDSEAEWGLHGRINKGPFSIAHGIAQAFRDRYDRMRDPDPGMLKLDGKLIYAWLEEHNGEHFVYPGERRPRPLLLLHEEFLRHGRIRPPEESAQDEPEVVKPDPQAERCRKEELWEQGEERRRKRQLIIDNLSPEDLSLIDSEADEVNVPKGKLSVQDEENSNTYIGFDDEGNPVRLPCRADKVERYVHVQNYNSYVG